MKHIYITVWLYVLTLIQWNQMQNKKQLQECIMIFQKIKMIFPIFI